MEAITLQRVAIRPLLREDLDAVVAIDAADAEHTRRAYFLRRLDAALREPKLHVQFAAEDSHGLAGYLLARVLEGEFGREERALRLEMIGVRKDARGLGIGGSMFDALCDRGRRHGLADVRTQAGWNDLRMLRWIDAMGFTLAPYHILACDVRGGEYVSERDALAAGAEGDEEPAREINYSGRTLDAFEHLARDDTDVRAMDPVDLDDIVRIDRSITGQDRRDYMRHKVTEALHGSAIRVSLTARRDGIVAGFVMARVDFGDFGRAEPVAVLDTIGVDADYTERGIGHALLSQLFVNLGALCVEQVETEVAASDLTLLRFFYGVGFGPSQQLLFARRLV
jgi:ribosomal protein S18 acetylase RimI-like enzyme